MMMGQIAYLDAYGVAPRQLGGLLQPPRAHQVHRQGMLSGGGQHPMDAGVGGVGRHATIHHDPNADGPRGGGPVGDRFGHGRIGGVDRLDQSESTGMLPVDLERIAGVVAVHREGRDQHRAVHPNGVHRGHHGVARDLRRAGQDAGPGAARMVAFIGVHLRIYDHHD